MTSDNDKIMLASDFHKDVYGCRPIVPLYFKNEAEERAWWIKLYDDTSAYFNSLKSTSEGRDMLRSQGWLID